MNQNNPGIKLEPVLDPGYIDMRCKRCEHSPESHNAGKGQCYSCAAEKRCVCWEPKSQLAAMTNGVM